MGFVQSIFGSNTGAGFNAKGLSDANVTQAQGNVQNAQGSQNALLAALQGQNGIANQNSVYNQMQNTAGQYQNLANGVGPNPAQAQLAQNTAVANVSQTGALMAGQRGASQNVGLLARQAGQQGAATQQQAAGQAATLQAQQQLAGLQGLQSQQANLANLSTQQVGQNITGAQNAANTALANQSNIYGLQSNINTTQAGIAAGNQKAQAGLVGGILGSWGAGVGTATGDSGNAVGAEGGDVVKNRFADGGAVAVETPNAATRAPFQQGPQSSFGQYLAAQQQRGMTQETGSSGNQAGAGLYQLGKAAYGGAKSLLGSKAGGEGASSYMPSSQDWYDAMKNTSGAPTDAEILWNASEHS